jgi:hypothetical protein
MPFLGLALLFSIFQMRDAYLNRVIDKKDTEIRARASRALTGIATMHQESTAAIVASSRLTAATNSVVLAVPPWSLVSTLPAS